MFSKYALSGGLSVLIEKRIPLASGLGGGSADAAAIIEAINELYELNIPKQELLNLGARIGADVPFCLTGGTALCEGIGDIITPIPGKCGGHVVLVKPLISISSKTAFGKMSALLDSSGNSEDMTRAIISGDIKNIASKLCNKMEQAAFPDHPAISELKKTMLTQNGCLGALMSGSGPTVYGLFENGKAAADAVRFLKNYENVEVFLCRLKVI
jgi:4-diphosphocytidyl-2-C-methyl-D-erythritol kinase